MSLAATPGPAADDAAPAVSPALAPAKPRRGLLRRLYAWVLTWADHPHASTALFAISFIESSFFPIPPDVLQVAITLSNRTRAWREAAISTLGSVLGGVLGYAIGWLVWQEWDGLREFCFRFVFKPSTFEMVTRIYQEYDVWFVFVAAFTPIPYKVFTIAGGVCAVTLPGFIAASALGRAGRFFLVAWLLHRYGAKVKEFLEKYFEWATLGLVVVGVLGYFSIKWVNALIHARF